MEFIIERKFFNLKTIKISNFSCKYCKTKTILNLTVLGGVASILLIPSVPIKKDYILTCENCQQRIFKNDLDFIEREKLNNEFKSTKYKIPIKHFSGIAILMIVMGFAIYTGIEMKKKEKFYISNPLINDVYYVKTDLGRTTFKVFKISSDSIYVFKNNLITDDYSKIHEIDVAGNYSAIIGFELVKLRNMYDENIIYQVNREK